MSSLLSAQSKDTLEVHKFQKPIEFDGLPFEDEWEKIDPLPIVMFTPKYGGELTERTEIRIGYDNQYFYISGRLYDSEPKKIQGNTLIRDFNTAGDFFNVCIDSFNDNETFLYFGTMPTGIRIDAEIANDAETEEVFNSSWNTFWDVKTIVNEQGWFVETRIPFSSLRYKVKDNQTIFGIAINRLIGRKFERHIFPDTPPNWSTAVWKASQAQKIKFSDIDQKRPFYIMPYILGGFIRENSVNQNILLKNNIWKKEAGIDVKLGISTNYTLDITVNTDFAQVEADNFQANLTRFSLFFPEKRQFFQERAGIFSFQTSGSNRLFNSRVIGLTADGEPQRVYGGVRLIGRVKGKDIGILSMQTESSNNSGSMNFTVLRYRERIFNRNSYIGGIFLSKIDGIGNYNLTYGIDTQLRLYGQSFLTLKGGQSFENNISNGYFLYGKYEKRAFKGFGYSFEFDKTNDNFNPGIGFILRRNFSMKQNLGYGFFLKNSKKIRSITPSFANGVYLRNADNSLETLNTYLGVDFSFLSGGTFGFGIQRIYDEVDTYFSISDQVIIPEGVYDFSSLSMKAGTNENKRIRISTALEIGKFYGSKNYNFSIAPSWNISKHVELRLTYKYNLLDFGYEKIRADIGSLRTLLGFNTKWSISSLIQYDKLNEKIGSNLRLRFNPKEGRDLYIVYNSLNNLQNMSSGNNLPNTETWSLFIKYTHALNLTK